MSANLLRTLQQLKTDRATVESDASAVAQYCAPNRRIYNEARYKSNIFPEILDDTAKRSAFILASAIHGAMTGQSTNWIHITTENDEDRNDNQIRTILDRIDRITTQELIEHTNFYPSMMEADSDFVLFGLPYTFIEERFDRKHGVVRPNFKTFPWEQCFAEEDEFGFIGTVYREFEDSAVNIMMDSQRYKNVPKQITEAAQKKPFTKFKIVHAIQPKRGEYKTYNPQHEYVEIYFLPEIGGHVLSGDNGYYSGYYEFPLMAPRFKKSPGCVYAISPAMDALPTIRMLNKIMELSLKAGELDLLPPIFYQSQSGFPANQPLVPGASYGVRDPGSITAYPTGSRREIAELMIAAFENKIEKHFLIDQIQFPSLGDQGTPATATEISTRRVFMDRILEPILSRKVSDRGLEHGMQRVINIMARNGRYGDISPLLERGILKIQFTGQLSRNQRFDESLALTEYMQMYGQIIQVAPEMQQRTDIGKAAIEWLRIRGVPESVIRSDEEYQALVQQQEEQQQAMMASELINRGADSLAKAGKAVA